jgi:signal transduction histidine kinase/ligand-binding sensor domain-containing protein/AraC-like DNA-binding protein
MREGIRTGFLTVLISLGILNTNAQHREYIYDHFNISNGLISDNVFKVAADREGHAWIITYNGLQRYNGYEFRTYTSRPGEEGTLSSNFVEDLFEDRDGDLVVVLEDAIDIYDKRSDRFSNLLSDLPFVATRRNEISRYASAVQDRSGSIWVNCNNHLVRIEPGKRDFIIFPDEFIGRFVLNADSTLLWIITDSEIKRYSLADKVLSITSLPDIPAPEKIERLNVIYRGSGERIWLGTSAGLFLLDENNLKIINPPFRQKAEYSAERTPDQNITAIYEDYRDDLWVGSGSELQRIDPATGSIQKLRHETEYYNSILGEQITGIHGNRSGIIWVTYLNEGFTRINIKTMNFRSYRHNPVNPGGLGGNTVRSVFKDPGGTIWVGLYNDGMDRIDPATGKVSHFKHDPGRSNTICSNYISSLFLDSTGRLWAGSHDNGLCYTDQPYSREPVFRRPGFLDGNDEIYHIGGDHLGRVWIGTRDGLGMFDHRSGSFRWVLKDHNVQSFLFDREAIWIASWNYGLCRLDFSGKGFRAETPFFDSLSSRYFSGEVKPGTGVESPGGTGYLQNCISIYRDRQGNTWLGTYNRGLVKAVPTDGDFRYTYYGSTKGAPGNAVYGIAGDAGGKIWISTERGIGRFDPETERFENFYREDGLLSDYFMWKSYHQAQDGELLFGSVDGLNLFYPHEISREENFPGVLFAELRIQNQPVECGDTIHGDVIMETQIAYADTLVLNHWNRDFSLSYYATGHATPDRIRYAHMLEGYDGDWITNPGGNRTATYSNLPSGTYRLRVRASVNESLWNDEFVEKTVIILPPWWKTKLAYVIYLMVIGGLAALIIFLLTRFLRLKHELIYNEKLHQSKLMFFTNISHEFKTPLSLIKAPLNDILNEKELAPHDRKNLLVARQNADNLLNLVNELMEFRRTDTGISRLRAEQLELTGFISEITGQFAYVAGQKRIQFLTDIPGDKVRIWVDREKFRKIIHNLLENALNYTRPDGLVTLSLLMEPDRFRFNPNYHTLSIRNPGKEMESIGILVSDTGVGISRESLPKIFERFYQIEAERASHHIGSGIGLALLKNLVLLHHGEIRVASERGVGTEILVLLPRGDRHLSPEELAGKGAEPSVEAVVTRDLKGGTDREETPVAERVETGHHPRILIVEDHAELRRFLSDNLSDGYRILEASNGREGLELMEKSCPDLIITDWIMPVMDGSEFIGKVREDKAGQTVPIILLTAKDEMKDIQSGLNVGADVVITKPFNLQLLRSQVHRIIANNRSRTEKFSLQNTGNMQVFHEDRDAEFMERTEKAILARLKEPGLNAAVICKDLGMSRTVFYEAIKRITGQTIGEYIQQIRLKHAIRLMLYKNVSVSEACLMVGFNSSSYMIRLFRKYYHTTPGEYIRNYLKTSSN